MIVARARGVYRRLFASTELPDEEEDMLLDS